MVSGSSSSYFPVITSRATRCIHHPSQFTLYDAECLRPSFTFCRFVVGSHVCCLAFHGLWVIFVLHCQCLKFFSWLMCSRACLMAWMYMILKYFVILKILFLILLYQTNLKILKKLKIAKWWFQWSFWTNGETRLFVWTVSKALRKYQPVQYEGTWNNLCRAESTRRKTEREQNAWQFYTTLFHVVEGSLQNSAVFTSFFVHVIVGLNSLIFLPFPPLQVQSVFTK